MGCETFRYSWIKVTDEDGRAATMRSALDLQQTLMERARTATGAADGLAVKDQLQMARCYLGEDVDHGTKIVIYPPPHDGSVTLHVLAPSPHQVSKNGLEISIAAMPAGYTRERALAWLDTPVGQAWAGGALACRLVYAVAIAEETLPMVAPQVHTQHTESPCSINC